MVDFYLQRVGPQSTTGTLRGASAEDFGAGIGEAMQRAGQTVERIEDRQRAKEKELDDQYQSTEAGKALAQFGADTDAESIAAQDNLQPGAAGYTSQLLESFDKRQAALLAGISNPKVRAQASVQVAEMRARVAGHGATFEAGARVKKVVADVGDQIQINSNRIRTTGDIPTFSEALSQFDTTLGALHLSDEQKRDIKSDAHDRFARSLIEGLPAEQGKAILTGGGLNQYLKPETLDALMGSNEVELRRVAHEKAAALATGKADTIEKINLLTAKVADGYEPTDEELAQASEGAKTYGLDVKAWNLGVMRVQRDFNRETKGWTPAQWDSEYSRLAAKGDKRSEAEDVRFKLVDGRRGAATAAFNSDPHGAAAAAGDPAPAVDWANPSRSQLEARSVWARSRARAAGLANVPYLSKDEMATFRGEARDPAGRLAVAVQLRGAFGVAAGADIARQIDPSDREMQLYVGLPPRTAEWVKDGASALKRNPGLFAAGPAAAVFNEFAPAIPPEMRDAVFTAAKAIVAAGGDQNGVVDWKDNDEGFAQSFRSALHRAAGQVGGGADRTGGFVNWNGRRAWLPQTMGVTDFQRRMSRAQPTDWLAAGAISGSSPYYRDQTGRLVQVKGESVKLFGKLQVETVSPGVYHLLGQDGRPFLTKTGQPWRFDIGKLGR